MKQLKYILIILLVTQAACSSDTSLFPQPSTGFDNDQLNTDYPNELESKSQDLLLQPISLALDTANNQIIIANSNNRLFFGQSTLVTIEVEIGDDLDRPDFIVKDIVQTPNFAGKLSFNNGTAYLPFRESHPFDSSSDQIRSYTIAADGEISALTTEKIAGNPFGSLFFDDQVFVVSNNTLEILSANDLTSAIGNDINLNLGNDAGNNISDSNATGAEEIAIDTTRNLAFVTNLSDNLIVVDLDLNRVTHIIDGQESSRGAVYDSTNDLIYVIGGNPRSLYALNPQIIDDNPIEDAANNSTVLELDDSEIMTNILPLESDPTGITLDEANNRGYIVNTGTQSLTTFSLNPFQLVHNLSLKDDDTNMDDAKAPFAVAVGTFTSTNNISVTYIFSLNIDSNNFTVIRADTLEPIASFPKQ